MDPYLRGFVLFLFFFFSIDQILTTLTHYNISFRHLKASQILGGDKLLMLNVCLKLLTVDMVISTRLLL